jgi:hypothetical protein
MGAPALRGFGATGKLREIAGMNVLFHDVPCGITLLRIVSSFLVSILSGMLRLSDLPTGR